VKILRTTFLFAIGWLVFAIASATPALLERLGLGALFDAHPTLPHFVTKTLLAVFVVLVVAADRRRTWADYGFRRATSKVPWWSVIAVGTLFGALATAAILLTPARGMTFLQQFGFLGFIVSVWLYSSLTEELFVRGWFQTAATRGPTVAIAGRSLSVAVVASALLFGSLHLSLFWKGTDVLTVVIIVCATTLLGLAAALFRQRYESLIPAFVTHVAFNVGGLLAGVIINIVAMIATGRPIQK
jgi:membrane protease YdiL (CAAX protease family)